MSFPLILTLFVYLIKCCNMTSETSICHFSWIFRDGFPLAQREEQMYEEQKQEEEAEKRQKEDFDNWLAKYKETMKNGWWNQCVWLKAVSYKQFFFS